MRDVHKSKGTYIEAYTEKLPRIESVSLLKNIGTPFVNFRNFYEFWKALVEMELDL